MHTDTVALVIGNHNEPPEASMDELANGISSRLNTGEKGVRALWFRPKDFEDL